MTDPTQAHNESILPMLRLITDAAQSEAQQWVILESLCLAIGKLHNRTARETALYAETIAERLATGDRT